MTIFAFITAGLMIGYLCSLIKQKEDEDDVDNSHHETPATK